MILIDFPLMKPVKLDIFLLVLLKRYSEIGTIIVLIISVTDPKEVVLKLKKFTCVMSYFEVISSL